MADKHLNRTITIKINGKDRPAQEQTATKGEIKKKRSHKKNVSIHNWQGNTEKVDVENLEEETFEQSAAASEEQFSWILPEEKAKPLQSSGIKKAKRPSIRKDTKGSAWTPKSSYRKKMSNKVATSIALIVLIAVLVGTSFGLVMVSMVKSDQKAGTESPPSEMASVTEENGNGSGLSAVETISAFIIQGGVFSTKEAAEKGLAQAVEKGIPGKIVEIDKQIYLFIGVADSIEHAKAMGGELEKEGFSFYAKEVTFGSTANTDLQEGEVSLVKQATVLYDTLASMSASATLSGNIPSGTKETLTGELKQWKKIDEKNIKTPEVLEMKKELDEAAEKMSSFEKNGDEKSVVGVQQHLLNYLALYHHL